MFSNIGSTSDSTFFFFFSTPSKDGGENSIFFCFL